jgi:hypothetical protein
MASVEKKKKADKDAKATVTTAFNTNRDGTADGRPVFKLGGAKPKAAASKNVFKRTDGNTIASDAYNDVRIPLNRVRREAKPKAAKARPETPGAYPAAKATPAPKPKAKPASDAPRPSTTVPKPTARPMKKASASAPAYTPPKAEKRTGGKVSSGFSGNWTGAAATDMQKRGGAKINRGGGLLGAVKRKLGK